MTIDAFQLVVVFTIVPFIPAAVLMIDSILGSSEAWLVAWMLYVGYPTAFGGTMWLDWSRGTGETGELGKPTPILLKG